MACLERAGYDDTDDAPADYDAVYALWMSCKNMGFNNLDDSREGIARFLRRNPATSF